MRPILLAGTSLLALALSVATASAGLTTTGTPGFYTFTVDVTGLWEVVATGAQGGVSGEAARPGGRAWRQGHRHLLVHCWRSAELRRRRHGRCRRPE